MSKCVLTVAYTQKLYIQWISFAAMNIICIQFYIVVANQLFKFTNLNRLRTMHMCIVSSNKLALECNQVVHSSLNIRVRIWKDFSKEIFYLCAQKSQENFILQRYWRHTRRVNLVGQKLFCVLFVDFLFYKFRFSCAFFATNFEDFFYWAER